MLLFNPFLCFVLLLYLADALVVSRAFTKDPAAGAERQNGTHQVDRAADIAVHECYQAIHQITEKEGDLGQAMLAIEQEC